METDQTVPRLMLPLLKIVRLRRCFLTPLDTVLLYIVSTQSRYSGQRCFGSGGRQLLGELGVLVVLGLRRVLVPLAFFSLGILRRRRKWCFSVLLHHAAILHEMDFAQVVSVGALGGECRLAEGALEAVAAGVGGSGLVDGPGEGHDGAGVTHGGGGGGRAGG